MKLNMDESSICNPSRSDYGDLRNSSVDWIFSFFETCGFSSNINAELQTISHDLVLAWTHDYIVYMEDIQLKKVNFLK